MPLALTYSGRPRVYGNTKKPVYANKHVQGVLWRAEMYAELSRVSPRTNFCFQAPRNLH